MKTGEDLDARSTMDHLSVLNDVVSELKNDVICWSYHGRRCDSGGFEVQKFAHRYCFGIDAGCVVNDVDG
ncbi:hypothetical protein TorRG33x02_130310 [Trema orientale]|uniref:Uncharacterized protein n=1 Tax=Trema orientale TaxID=63057 RepID=A0A2P5F0B0_TREOI|nr:hypothetical protein TorRG33x02_130310 [Trema orientale]